MKNLDPKISSEELNLYSQISSKERALITLITIIGTFMAILDTTIVEIIIPKLTGPLSTDLYGVQWVVISYMLSAAITLLFVIHLAVLIGYKYVFISGVFLFTVASFFCGNANSLAEMIIARSVQGIGEAFIVSSAQVILFFTYPLEKRGTAMGIYGLGVSFAPALGPTLGGFLTEHFSWRWVFFINVPIGILLFFGSLFFLPSIKIFKKFKFNFISYLFISIGTICLLIMLSKGQQYGWFQSTFIITLFFISIIAFLLYFLSELLSKEPLINFSIYKIPEFGLSMGLHFFLLGFGMYQVFYLFPLYFENLKGLTTLQTGFHILGFALTVGIFSIISGIISDKISPYLVLSLSLLIFIFTTYFILPQINYYTPSLKAALYPIPLGIAIGCFFAPLSTISLKKLGKETGLGVVLMQYKRFIGGSFGTAIATNHLQFNLNKHYLKINELQNHYVVENFLSEKTNLFNQFFSLDLAEKKAKALLYKAQYIQALSWAFQDTFKQITVWGIVGGIFLIILLLKVYLQAPFSGSQTPLLKSFSK